MCSPAGQLLQKSFIVIIRDVFEKVTTKKQATFQLILQLQFGENVHKYGRGQFLLREGKSATSAICCKSTDSSARTLKHTPYFCLQVQETNVIPTPVTDCCLIHKLDICVYKTLNPSKGRKRREKILAKLHSKRLTGKTATYLISKLPASIIFFICTDITIYYLLWS